ncbi:ATP-binding protein [Ekhidna sp.]|uniref:ATP-binding protein n=1 Tax=Ekhidna sp. TaxID=2608089 RepID=UPI003CCBF34F
MLRLIAAFVVFSLTSGEVFSRDGSHQDGERLEVTWYTSFPFVYEDENGVVTGVEPEMFSLFQEYMKKKGRPVDLVFTKAKNFADILKSARSNKDEYIVGASALSITEKREEYAQFTESYLPDVTVLVSSAGTPIVNITEEKVEMIRNLDAVTIKGTKYESLLNNLRDETGVNFNIIYLSSDQNILEGILASDDRFGFIDLPIYLLRIQSGGEVTRQNFFTTKGEGYAFILPDNSIWKTHLDAFLTDPESKEAIASIIAKYLGQDVFEFIDNLYGGQELGTSILTKEKEMQLALIRNANLKLEEEQSVRRILIVSTSVLALFLFAIGYLFYKNKKSTQLLIGQTEQIEEQQSDIQQKNEQLMNRNAQLVALNEEKNNLVKILAHDIRSPLSQIIMITDIVNQNIQRDLTETEQKMLSQVSVSAERINKMVTKILDVEGLEEHRMNVLQERVDISLIMKDIAHRYQPIAAQKGIDLTVEFCVEHNIIRTDHLLLLLVLENLISNAVKFSDSGSTVSLKAECTYDSVLFKVSDEGPGFSEADKKKLFNRFQKLSARPTGGEKSTGLGLSIVKKYVTDLRGKVWVESDLGKGATFFVKLEA